MLSEMSHNMSEDPQELLKKLGVKTTVTRRGPIPAGPPGPPLGGGTMAPGQDTPAATAGGAKGAETGGAGEGGERDKNPGSATSFTTYVGDISFLISGLILCFKGPDRVQRGISDTHA